VDCNGYYPVSIDTVYARAFAGWDERVAALRKKREAKDEQGG
jgi:hypothetical protein